MKSLASCLATMLVIALLVIAGIWIFHQVEDGIPILGSRKGKPEVTVRNQTRSSLSVRFQGPVTLSVDLPAGASGDWRLPAGTYAVEGQISDPDTDPFAGTWILEEGGRYTAGFERDGDGAVTVLLMEPAGGISTEEEDTPPAGPDDSPE